MTEVTTIIVSMIASIVVAYATTKLTSYSKDVVEERKEWRDQVRKLTVEAVRLMQLNETKTQRFYDIFSEFRVRLNPDDKDDNDILETLRTSMNHPNDILMPKFLAQIARLLKHDWERAKSESGTLGIFRRPNGPNMRLLKSSDYMD